jgi:hypothetical protein
MAEHASSSSAEDRIVIDLGARPSKQVKLLRRGQGRLLEEVDDCVAELRSAGVIDASAQVVVVAVQEQTVHRPGASMMLLPGFPPMVVP